jgi:hypothetical protein
LQLHCRLPNYSVYSRTEYPSQLLPPPARRNSNALLNLHRKSNPHLSPGALAKLALGKLHLHSAEPSRALLLNEPHFGAICIFCIDAHRRYVIAPFCQILGRLADWPPVRTAG